MVEQRPIFGQGNVFPYFVGGALLFIIAIVVLANRLFSVHRLAL